MSSGRTVLCYGDSLSWGVVPGTRERLPWPERWTGVLQAQLGGGCRVIEECLNGRTTAWDDAARPGRHGLAFLSPLLETHAPLDLVIVFLGSNDLQARYAASAEASARGIEAIIRTIQASRAEPTHAAPAVLLVIPPAITAPAGAMREKFAGAVEKSAGLGERYAAVARATGCECFDAGRHVVASAVDGIHLEAAAHRVLGERLAPVVATRLS
ncbi:MAG: SGNH/GDSL hydrolase family protein [Pseudomonadota bacterium]